MRFCGLRFEYVLLKANLSTPKREAVMGAKFNKKGP